MSSLLVQVPPTVNNGLPVNLTVYLSSPDRHLLLLTEFSVLKILQWILRKITAVKMLLLLRTPERGARITIYLSLSEGVERARRRVFFDGRIQQRLPVVNYELMQKELAKGKHWVVVLAPLLCETRSCTRVK